MELRVHLLEARLVDVRIDLRRGDAGVAKHFLYLTQVGAAGQEVRGEAVPRSSPTAVKSTAGEASLAAGKYLLKIYINVDGNLAQKYPYELGEN